MKIGYACLTIGVKDTNYKTCVMKNVNHERLAELISHNLYSLENTIDYNIKNSIKLFRITSDLIPFGSSEVNQLEWWNDFKNRFEEIGKKIKKSGMRISMHPGQYTVLNSPKKDVVERAIMDLKYHTKVIESLGCGQESKIILHIGGVYGDKKAAIERFIASYQQLDENIKKHLVIENDDKSYTVEDVLYISSRTKIPVVFDNLHHAINHNDNKSEKYWIDKCKDTWRIEDGYQKIHYSQQDISKKMGSHSKTINSQEFLNFFEILDREDIDIMLEVKDKNLSAVKCINSIAKEKNIKVLELEWKRYKYKILETNHRGYLEIRELLKDKESYPVLDFYKIIDKSLEQELEKGGQLNAVMHIWGYFKNKVTEKEKQSFKKKIDSFGKDNISIKTIKNILLKLAVKYNEEYILDSYYFSI